MVVVVILMCFLQCHGLSIEGFVLPSSTTREVMSDYTLHMKLREKFYCFSIFYFFFFFLNLSSYHLNATLGIWEKSGIFAKLHQNPKNPSFFLLLLHFA